VEAHSLFATTATWLYGLLLTGELLAFLTPTLIQKLQVPQVTTFLVFIQKILTHPALSKIITFLGLVAITITGLLGGVMVYGLTADPLAPLVLRILGIQY
ncbi:MAG TPA: hypothetical protein VLB02_01910, partial [Candidatus Paceibacterota bacterium]|nr:hypothetical protein [Candidatus Paceibacterota bacterium]